MNKHGVWWLESKTDSKWNCSGISNSVGGFSMPIECKEKIKELTDEYKVHPPKDLEFGYMKD